jgi:hypothetical protein
MTHSLAVHEMSHLAVSLAVPGVTTATIVADEDGYTVNPDCIPEGHAALDCILAGVIGERIHVEGIHGARDMAERLTPQQFMDTPTGAFDLALVGPMMTRQLLLECFDRVAPAIVTMLMGMDDVALATVEARLRGLKSGEGVSFRRSVQ